MARPEWVGPDEQDVLTAATEHETVALDDVNPSAGPRLAPVLQLWHRDVPKVDLSDLTIDPAAATLIPSRFGERHGLIGLGFEDGQIVVAMSDPGNVLAIDDVRTLTGFDVKRVYATRAEIMEVWRTLAPPDVTGALAAAEDDAAEQDDQKIAVVEDAPIIRLVNMLFAQAIMGRASDIHIEPNEGDVRVRFRIDGVLHEQMRLRRSIHASVVSRIKIMSEIDIAERRIPQDGRGVVTVNDIVVDLRVATLPTMHGEKVVIRILDKSNAQLDLDELGLSAHTAQRYRPAFRRPQGMILVTGPTGSGKTTTLYATLSALNEPERNVITVEDPIEYALPGTYQVQVRPKAGLTFAAALRSILRSDPDIVLVGEIRDRETAQLAIDAALTGHLVLSSLHTNDAASALSRLTEMGIEPFLVASAVDCVLGQRLVRVLCEHCKQPYEASVEEARAIGIQPVPGAPPVLLMRPVGCARCAKTGYRGRTGIHETLLVSEEIERMTVDRRPSEEIARVSRRQGMRPLCDDALEKILLGITSVEEVMRVVGAPRTPPVQPEAAKRTAETPPALAEEVPVAVPAPPVPAVPAAPGPEPAPTGGISWQVGPDGRIRVRFGA